MKRNKMKKEIKYIVSFLIIGLVIILLGVMSKNEKVVIPRNQEAGVLLATNYVPLVSKIDATDTIAGKSMSAYIQLFFRWGLSLAILLSTVMIILGGFQYMTTDAVYDKSDGKEKIKSAIAGLLLALSAWLILNTINPEILKNPTSDILK